MNLYKKSMLIMMLGVSFAGTVEAAELSHRLLKFSNIESISPIITQAQCQSLFADTVVPDPSFDQIHGKKPIITADQPISITNTLKIVSLEGRGFHAFSNQYAQRLFQGEALVDFGSASIGRQKVRYEVVSTMDLKTKQVQGVTGLGYFCVAQYTSALVS
ncbi:MAG: hypothetical protein V4496_08000 [Pseudomonadota bacterium]